jgi:integrase
MSLGKQAKVLTKHQQNAILSYLKTTRHAQRNELIFMLSFRAGLRAKEIASLTWSMISDAEGNIGKCITLTNSASKGKSGGVIWLNDELQQLLINYHDDCGDVYAQSRIVRSERKSDVTSQVIINMFQGWYKKLGFEGASSHSGRRTFITNCARKISSAGGSIRDVQNLARHSSLQMTQRYIDSDVEAQKKVVNMI